MVVLMFILTFTVGIAMDLISRRIANIRKHPRRDSKLHVGVLFQN